MKAKVFLNAALLGYGGKPIQNQLEKMFNAEEIKKQLDFIVKNIKNKDLDTDVASATLSGENKIIGESSTEFATKLNKAIENKKVALLKNNIEKKAFPGSRFGKKVDSTVENLAYKAKILARDLVKKYLSTQSKNTPFVMFANLINNEALSLPNKTNISKYTIGEFLKLYEFVILFLKNANELIRSFNITSSFVSTPSRGSTSSASSQKENILPRGFSIKQIQFQPNIISQNKKKAPDTITIRFEVEKAMNIQQKELIKRSPLARSAIAKIIIEDNMIEGSRQSKIAFKTFIDVFFSDIKSVEIEQKFITFISNRSQDIFSDTIYNRFQVKGNIWLNKVKYDKGGETKLTIEANLKENKIIKESYSTAQPYYKTKDPDGNVVRFSITDLVMGGGKIKGRKNGKSVRFKPSGWTSESIGKKKG